MNQAGLSGDPFTDVGAAVLQTLLAQHPNWQEQDALKFATDVYVQSWQSKLHAFFLNSGITNPANKGKEVERTLEYYGALLADDPKQAKGWCRVSGQYEPLFPAGRENQVLAGSGTFLNFNHGLEQGLQLGRSALLNIYFAPLGCLEVGGNPALIHSSRPEVTVFLAASNLKENLRPAATELKPGLAKSSRGNAANALFGYVDDILKEVKRESSKLTDGSAPALTLYNFTNFGAKPDVVLHHLSATVFDFYQQVMSEYKEPWTWFVRAHYRSSKFKGARAQPDTTALFVPGKAHEALTIVEPTTYRAWYNPVYNYLLAGRSLLEMIKKWCRYQRFPFDLTTYYCEKILHMDQRTFELISRVARYVATQTDDSAIKRTLTRLSTARTGSEVRLLLVGLQRRNYETDATEPLLRLDDYVRYLFPDGSSWREIRDLLLISLYEQLHENNRHVELEEGLEEVAAGDEDTDTDQE
ncbi:type I-B CRISPR-associated protein Cas8b1/Cst1 [Hymenobacter bucti]|uniref:Type I-B CRISPR-associated protein Cas8b1/Cst1 n=1 Tax=Hymenobacter bucti TaxID=1844114 RepID=A0ABW4QYV2_9BACT